MYAKSQSTVGRKCVTAALHSKSNHKHDMNVIIEVDCENVVREAQSIQVV